MQIYAYKAVASWNANIRTNIFF